MKTKCCHLMRLVLVALCAVLFTAVTAKAETTTLRFSSSVGYLKPFYWEENGETKGIIADIFQEIPGIAIKLILTPHKRLDTYLKEDRLDAAMLHPKYTKADDTLVFIPLNFFQENILFTHRQNGQNHTNLEDLRNVSVCARFGYRYINLNQRWDTQNLTRVDLKTNIQVLQMLERRRCDYSVGSKLSFLHLIKNHGFSNISATSISVNAVPRFIALSKRYESLRRTIDTHVKEMKADGRLDQILRKYTEHNILQ